jgi:acyl carrier protein
MEMTTEDRVRQFIVENFYLSDPAEIDDETLLATGGYIDSTGMLEVVAFLEQQFGIRITDQETTPENLDSVSRMAEFVRRKQSVLPPQGGMER